jgi:hypothetical protein
LVVDQEKFAGTKCVNVAHKTLARTAIQAPIVKYCPSILEKLFFRLLSSFILIYGENGQNIALDKLSGFESYSIPLKHIF